MPPPIHSYTSVEKLLFWIGGLLISLFLLTGCSRYNHQKNKPISGILREYHSGAVVRQATITAPKCPSLIVYPDTLGYFKFPRNTRKILGRGDTIQIKTISREVKIPLSGNMTFLKILLKDDNPPAHTKPVDPVADMHYHITMKPHNEYGVYMYKSGRTQRVEETRFNLYKKTLSIFKKRLDINLYLFKRRLTLNVYNDSADNDPYLLWSIRYRKMKVLQNGEYVTPGTILPISAKYFNPEAYARLETLYEGKWVKPQKLNNSLHQFTQATMPHLKDGNVRLAFNAISPFEYNLANSWQKRLISKLAKSNGARWWLKTIGGYYEKDNFFYLTHWQNFKNERELLKNQQTQYNNFDWQFLQKKEELDSIRNPENTHYIVNVLEGSHAFQDKILMQYLYTKKEIETRIKTKQYKIQLIKAAQVVSQDSINQYKLPPDTLAKRMYYQMIDSTKSLSDKKLDTVSREAEKDLRMQAMNELRGNIRKVKSDTEFPIFMVTISHLSWNGMTGQAPGLDANGIARSFIKRLYRIKASDDKPLLDQWKSLFYSEPINEFGKTLINDLLDKSIGNRSILIDLKHADYFTRKYFYDSVITKEKYKEVPPICSHCAVNGLKEIYHSPLVDEYSLLKSAADSVFYPFGLNLYDEEITQICRRGGIIGINLEQRVLGGYPKKSRQKLIDKSMWLMQTDTTLSRYFEAIRAYNDSVMRVPSEERTFSTLSRARFMDDYFSTEPFLQNLFYILDHSEKTGKTAWSHVCIGSDLDGIIDPIDVCATASQYPHFRKRMMQFIPLFLHMRQMHNPNAHPYAYYFNDIPKPAESVSLQQAMDALMYESLKEFVHKHFN